MSENVEIIENVEKNQLNGVGLKRMMQMLKFGW